METDTETDTLQSDPRAAERAGIAALQVSDVIVIARTKSAQQAVDAIQRSPADLVFLDRALLTTGEVRALRRLLERGSPLIAFVMTEPQPLKAFERPRS